MFEQARNDFLLQSNYTRTAEEFSNVAMRNVYIQRVQLLALTTNINHWRNVTIYVTKKRINFQGNYLVLYRFLSKNTYCIRNAYLKVMHF